MRRTGSILRQQKDTCSCWACRDRKFREKRKTEKQKALNEEDNHPAFSRYINQIKLSNETGSISRIDVEIDNYI